MINRLISLPEKHPITKSKDSPPSSPSSIESSDDGQFPQGEVLIVASVPTKVQDALVIVCFSEFCKESTAEQRAGFFNRLPQYIKEKKPIIFLNEDDDWHEIDTSFLQRHMPQEVAKLWNQFNTQDRFRQMSCYENVVSHLGDCNTVEIGGSFKEFCVTMCAVNICRDTIITSMDGLTLPFTASELDEDHQWIRIPHGIISDIMSLPLPPQDPIYSDPRAQQSNKRSLDSPPAPDSRAKEPNYKP